MSKLTLVIPAYNEQDNIRPFVARSEDVFRDTNYVLEYIFVDDGSTDETYARVRELIDDADAVKDGNRVIGLSFSRNFGKESAILAGLEAATGDYVCIIDADLQQDPQYALEMAQVLARSDTYDCVACYPKNRREGGVLKFFKKAFYKIMNGISDTEFAPDASDFRTMRRGVVDAILRLQEYNRFSKGIFSWVGFNIYLMPYEVHERAHGQSNWSFRKLTGYAIDGFVGYSTAPLKAASWVGGLVSLAALIYLIVVIVQHFTQDVTPGYSTIICLLLIIGGLVLLFLGILGEYIARMYLEVKHRPIYIVKRRDEKE